MEIVAKWIDIKYDYLSKYCKNCKLQGHNEKECFVLHSELYPNGEEKRGDGKAHEVNAEEKNEHVPRERAQENKADQWQINGARREKFINKGGQLQR